MVDGHIVLHNIPLAILKGGSVACDHGVVSAAFRGVVDLIICTVPTRRLIGNRLRSRQHQLVVLLLNRIGTLADEVVGWGFVAHIGRPAAGEHAGDGNISVMTTILSCYPLIFYLHHTDGSGIGQPAGDVDGGDVAVIVLQTDIARPRGAISVVRD